MPGEYQYPGGMTAADHDRVADDLSEEAAALQVIVDRINARIAAHRRTAEGLRETYAFIRDQNRGG